MCMTEDGPPHTYAEHVVAPLLRPVLKPAVQSKHASARAAGAYVPAGHDSQLCSFFTYVPASQLPHEDRSAELSLP